MDDVAYSKDVRVMLGDPKKAIWYFSIPIAVALLVQQGNNIVDSIWVTALGGASMAALGIVYPVYAALVGVGTGLGIGASAAIARTIGRNNCDRASSIASQGFTMVIIMSLILTPVLILTARPLLELIGAGSTLEESLMYAYPLYISTILVLMSGMISGIMRGEGAVKRSMYIQVLAAVVNIILDPIFIYTFGWGVAGAAWATVVAFASSIVLGLYWYCVKNDMFLKIKIGAMRFSRSIQKEILSVGLPESMELAIINIFNILCNFFVIMVGGTDMVAMYSVAWRIALIIIIPAQAIGGAIVSACSAQYGMRRFDMMRSAFRYSIKSSMIWMLVMSVVLALSAGLMASVFTYPPDLNYMYGDMVTMLYFFVLFIPFMTFVYVGSSLLLALNRAAVAMVSSLIRNMVLVITFGIAAYTVGTAVSLWWMLVAGEVFGGLLMWYLAHVALKTAELRDTGISA